MRPISLFFLLVLTFCATTEVLSQDWRLFYGSNIDRYRPDNEKLGPAAANEDRVVLFGNSITEAWPVIRPEYFEKHGYVGRGISGQTTPQMLLRFRTDVISLKPKAVVILAGTNDIAGNTGYTPIEIIAENLMTMSDIARQHDIEVVLCSVLPAIDYPWQEEKLYPAEKIVALNALIEAYARENDITYVDYHAALRDDENGLKVPEYTTAKDLVHPNAAGYKVMENLIQPVINKILNPLRVPSFFADHMVLQRNESVAIWGTAAADETIEVDASWGEELETKVLDDNTWYVRLDTPEAGGPYSITIRSDSESIEIKDVLIGEVWLASGQSNMEMPLKGWPPSDPIRNSAAEIANANYPNIRMFNVPRSTSMKLERDVVGEWELCNPSSAADFSATAYFFAQRLHQELGIPIGILNSTWGGTPAESWASKAGLKTLGDFDGDLDAMSNPKLFEETEAWYAQYDTQSIPTDEKGWNEFDWKDAQITDADYDDSAWSSIMVPGRIDEVNGQDVNGAFWLRRSFNVKGVASGYTFESGAVDDTDEVYINGVSVGGMINRYNEDRKYDIPAGVLKEGKNTIAIRVVDTGGPGSINGHISIKSNDGTLPLDGRWKVLCTAEIYKGKMYSYPIEESATMQNRPNIVHLNAHTPSVLYNAMIHPLIPYSFKGAIWYQGESNVGRAEQYERLFPLMITDWRSSWGEDFPFYFVQIAPFDYSPSEQDVDLSADLRDAQRKTLSLKQTGMVVTLDIGNNKNIHPANKQDVGRRLAGLALANDYQKGIESSGPLYRSHTVKKDHVFIDFDNKGRGLHSIDKNLAGFEIAGADKVFVPAKAKIKGGQVRVCADGVKAPVYVRYAWKDTSTATLFNKDGLPASSFSTE